MAAKDALNWDVSQPYVQTLLDMWRAYQIIRARDGKTVLRGRTQWICIDMKSGRPRRQPPEFIAAYVPALSART